MAQRIERKLTTMLAADVADYTGHMRTDEMAALEGLRNGRSVLTRLIAGRGGRVVNTAGDGLIAEFPSVVEAVRCAVDAQQELSGLQGAALKPMRFRIGVHLDDVMVDGEDLLGDGVNLAARLQQMAAPGAVLVSRQVYDHVGRKLQLNFASLGYQRLKNLDTDVEVFSVEAASVSGTASPAPAAAKVALPPATPAAMPPPVPRGRTAAKTALTIAFVLVVVDLMTAGGPWAQFPVIALGVVAAMRTTASWAPAWLDHRAAVYGVGVVGLAALNLATWNGDLWVTWLAGAYVVWFLVRRGWARFG